MNRLRRKSGLFPGFLLATLLLAAQFGALLHAYEHDTGVPQGKACTLCVTAGQLESACIANHSPHIPEHSSATFDSASRNDFPSFRAVCVRQRGPPAPL